MLNTIVVIVILSPIWGLMPYLIYTQRKYDKRFGNKKLYDSGSNIGISANYWAD